MDLRSLKYDEYLKTEYWKNLSETIKREADYRCQICNSEENLNVHHRSYEHKGFLELEKKDLICICEKCHSIYHINQNYNGDIQDITTEFFEKLEAELNCDNKKIITGIQDLDSSLNITEGELLLLSGETLIYSNFIYNMYLKNIEKSIFIGSRLSREKIMTKLFSLETGIDFTNKSVNVLRDDDWRKMGLASGKLSRSTSKIFTEIYELKEIEAVVSKYHLEKKLFLIDSLNYLLKNNWNNSEIESLMREIKKIAKKYSVYIVLNYDFPTLLINKVRSRADRRPMQSDLDIVCNFLTYVDNILLFYRDDYYDKDSELIGIAEVIIPKLNKIIGLRYFKDLGKFTGYKRSIDE